MHPLQVNGDQSLVSFEDIIVKLGYQDIRIN